MIYHYESMLPQTQNVFVRLPEFFAGMYICKYREKIRGIGMVVSLIGSIVILVIPITFVPQMFMVTLMGVFCYIVFYWAGLQIKSNSIQKPFTWFAKYSFAIYLLHHVISEQIIDKFTGVVLTNIEVMLLFVIVVVCDIVGGYILYNITQMVLKKTGEWKNGILQVERRI